VSLEGAGSIQSGHWFVWSVRHKITVDAVKLQFTLVRNAMGPAPSASGLGALAGAITGALG